MTEYLIAARAVIILWTGLAAIRPRSSLTRLNPNLSAAASSHNAPVRGDWLRELFGTA
jgi:hypothetical protein